MNFLMSLPMWIFEQLSAIQESLIFVPEAIAAGPMTCVAKIDLVAELVAWEGRLDVPLEASFVFEAAPSPEREGRFSPGLHHSGLRWACFIQQSSSPPGWPSLHHPHLFKASLAEPWLPDEVPRLAPPLPLPQPLPWPRLLPRPRPDCSFKYKSPGGLLTEAKLLSKSFRQASSVRLAINWSNEIVWPLRILLCWIWAYIGKWLSTALINW